MKLLRRVLIVVIASLSLSCYGPGQVFTEDSPPDDCTAGVADGDVTVDGRPLLWKLRINTDESNDIHYFRPGVEYYPGLGPATYSFLGMGPAHDSPGPVRQGLNSQGLAIGWSTLDSNGWEVLHYKSLGYYNTVTQVRAFINQMTDLSTYNYFIDSSGEAALWESQIGLSNHWEYNTRAPARDNQWIDVDNADGDANYATGTDVNLSGWVSRANAPGHFNTNGTDDLEKIDRYKIGRDLIGSAVFNDGNGTALSTKSLAIDTFRNDGLALDASVSGIIVQGVLPIEDPRLSTMWTLLGHSETGIFVPVWLHGVEAGTTSHVPQYLDHGDDGISDYEPARGMFNAGFNQTNVQARTLPFEEHLFDVVDDILLPDWRSRDWADVAVTAKIGQEMRRVQEQMDVDAYRHLKYLYDHGSSSNYAPTILINSVSFDGLEATFSVTASDGDGDILTYLYNFGDGQTSSDMTHTYAQAGHYLVSCTVTDAHGVSQTDWLFVTVASTNEPPNDISLDPNSVNENQPINTEVGIFSTSDPDAGDTFTYTLVGGTGSIDNASFTISGNSLRTTSVLNFEARSSYAIHVRTTDQGGLSFEKAFTITVNNLNEDPMIQEGASSNMIMDEDGAPTAFDLTLHSTDPEDDTLTWSISSQAIHGTASTAGIGTSTVIGYTPANNYNGSDSFMVQVSENNGGTDTITVNVTIIQQNDAPVCSTAILVTSMDMAGDASPNCTEVDTGDTLTYTIVTQGENGTASVVAGLLHYLPATGYSGTDTFTYKADDAHVDSNTATVIVSVTSVTQNISLISGWNMVSFPLHPTSPAILAVLKSIEGSYDLVYAWDASGAHSTSGNWMRFAPGIPIGNTLSTLDETQGFWIHMTNPDVLEITGRTPTTSIDLLTIAGGWNLAGYPSDQLGNLPDVLILNGVTDFSLVYAYHANDPAVPPTPPWKRYAVGVPIGNDLTELSPGWGYWIKVSTPSTWIVPRPIPPLPTLMLDVTQSPLTVYPPIMIYTAQMSIEPSPTSAELKADFYNLVGIGLVYLGSATVDSTGQAVLNKQMYPGTYTAYARVVINSQVIWSNGVTYKVH